MTSLRAIYRHLVVFNRYSGFHYYINLVFMMQTYCFFYFFILLIYKRKYLSTSLSCDRQFQFHFINRSKYLCDKIKLILGPKSSCMCGHANIFHLWVKCQLSWIVQITWIYDTNWLNLLTVLAFPNCHVQPLTQCSACGRQSVFGRSRSCKLSKYNTM
jgi:hypothetical protein